MRPSVADRFWSKVDKNGPNGCWEWLASRRNGYGQFAMWPVVPPAHRVAWELEVGPIEDGAVLDHLCRNRGCVNPSHLRAVTQRENILAPGAQGLSKINADKTHCVNGHEFTPENTTHQGPDGRYRRCRTCNRDRVAAFRDARRSETCTCGHFKSRRRDGSLYCRPCLSEQARVARRAHEDSWRPERSA